MRLSSFLAIPLPVVFTLTGCSFDWDWLHYVRARRAIVQHDYKSAVSQFQTIIQNQPDSERSISAARQGARLAHLELKNYPLAVFFYRHLILKAHDHEERKTAQKYIAQIQFENLLDYDQAVLEYEKLLRMDNPPSAASRYRLNLAKSHFHLNNLDQAANEIDILLSHKPTEDEIFEAKTLKANILVSAKRLPEAAEVFEQILRDFPERSKKHNMALSLVVCYEELKDFHKAIDVLERMKPEYPNPDFLKLRIERLRERMSNQPGAQGWKR